MAAVRRRCATSGAAAWAVERLEGRQLLSGVGKDPAYGSDGTAVVPLGSGGLAGRGAAVLADGQLLVCHQQAGATGGTGFGVTRLNADGTVDTTYGSGAGTATAGFSNANALADNVHLAVQADGGAVLLANTTGRTASGAFTAQVDLERFTPAGVADPTFGTGGIVDLTPLGMTDGGTVVVDASGDILVGGATAANRLAVLRLTPTGAADPTFGSGGLASVAEPGPIPATAVVTTLAVEPDGSVLLAGTGQQSGSSYRDWTFAHVSAAGVADPSFTTTLFDPFRQWSPYALTPLSGGGFLAGGMIDGGAGLAEFTAAGQLNPAFGTGGVALVGNAQDEVTGARQDADGTILIGGFGPEDAFVGRLTSLGGADTTFYPLGGVTTASLPGDGDVAQSVTGNAAVAFAADGGSAYVVTSAAGAGSVYATRFLTGTPTSATGAVTGSVYDDANDDGVRQATESGLAGVNVYLVPGSTYVYRSGDTTNEGGGVPTGASAVARTDATGTYTFPAVAPGTYTVVEPDQSATAAFAVAHPASQTTVVTVAAGQTVSGVAFGDAALSDFSGTVLTPAGVGLGGVYVYLDANGNGQFDAATERAVTTDSTGGFAFFDIDPGAYTVRQVVPAGYVVTAPATGGYAIALPGTPAGLSFVDAPAGSVAGTVFADANGNGSADAGDGGVAGRTVYLDANGDGSYEAGEPVTTTTAAGAFTLAAVPAGTYAVRQVLPAGYRQTTKVVTVTVAAGGGVSGVALGTNDAGPTAAAGGPYTVPEGGTVTLSAAASLAPAGGSIAAVAWDWTNYTGATFTPTATGTTVTFSAAGLDGPATVTVGLRVTDDAGNASLTKATINLTDAPPTGTFAAGGPVVLGRPGSVAFAAVTDPSPADVAAGFTYGYDLNDDGTIDLTGTAASAVVPAAYLSTAGVHTVRGRVTDKDGGHTDYTTTITVSAASPTPTPTKLAGSVIGTAGSYKGDGDTIAKATDGNLSTYFDAAAGTGAWVGLDLGSARAVTAVAFAPRSGYASRMVGGLVQASADPTFATGVVTAYTVAAAPPAGKLTTVGVSTPSAYRYWRYLGPANANCNIAEFQVFGPAAATPAPLTGTTIGTPGSYKNGGNTIAKATDGSLSTYFDGAAADGNWVGLDLGSAESISQFEYAPRSGYAGRMVGGAFQVSTTADFSSGVTTLYTIAAAPVGGSLTTVKLSSPVTARYVRYLSPAGSNGDVAEFQVFG